MIWNTVEAYAHEDQAFYSRGHDRGRGKYPPQGGTGTYYSKGYAQPSYSPSSQKKWLRKPSSYSSSSSKGQKSAYKKGNGKYGHLRGNADRRYRIKVKNSKDMQPKTLT